METVLAVGSIILNMIIAMALFVMQHTFKKRDDERRGKDKVYLQYHQNSYKATMASLALGEANALAIKRGEPNGETEIALQYAKKIKNEQKDFMCERGLTDILN